MNMHVNGATAPLDKAGRPAFVDWVAEHEAAADEHFAAEMATLARYRAADRAEGPTLTGDIRAIARIATGVTIGILLGSLAIDTLIAAGLWPMVEGF